MRKVLRHIFWVFICMIGSFSAFSQDSTTLSFEEFQEIVIQHHPLSRQSELLVEKGIAYRQKAKGNFDPKIDASAQQKYFNGDQYYSLINAGLKIPTWYGLSVKAGFDQNDGTRLNNQNYLPDAGLWYAGIELAVGKGLLIDNRRAELKKAKIYVESSIQQQRLLLNQLIYESASAYWDWFKAYNKLMVYSNAMKNAQFRLKSTVEAAELGDKPFMDTLEAHVQMQTVAFSYLDAQYDYYSKSRMMEMYLWGPQLEPLELDSLTRPPQYDELQSSTMNPEMILKIDSLRINHPEVLNTQYKIDMKKVDIQLGIENLKPELNLKYNAIAEPILGNPFSEYSIENYTWGLDFSIPIFLRKERNQLKIYRIEKENLENALAFKQTQVNYKVAAQLKYLQTVQEQIAIWDQTTLQYQTLLDNEFTLFNIGESSMFKVNYRQKKFIEAQTKLIEVLAENEKSILKLNYVLGIVD